MTDKQFLTWIHERLVHEHNENRNMDYMWKLRSIIEALEDDQTTANTTNKAYLEGMVSK